MTSTVVPTNQNELLEFLADQEKVQKLLSTPEGRKTYDEKIGLYKQHMLNKDNSLMVQLEDMVNRRNQELMKEFGKEAKTLNLNVNEKSNGSYSYLQNKKAPGAKLNGQFGSIGEFFYNTWFQKLQNPDSPEMAAKVRDLKNYTERVASEGGFLVPEEFRAEIMRVALEKSLVRPRARVVPMGSLKLSLNVEDATSNVSSLFGGVTVQRVPEGGTISPSAGQFARVTLEASKQVAMARVTNELIRDAVGAFDAWIMQTFPEALAFEEDWDFLTGSGVGEPLGALTNHSSMITVSKESGQVASTIVWENVIKMYARLHPRFEDDAIWVVSPDTFPELATMALTVGTGGSGIWLTDGAGKPRLTLLGLPVYKSEKAPAALGTQGDVSLVSFNGYVVGDRQTVTVDSSEHSRFSTDETEIRAIARNDGRPWLLNAVTPRNNSATLSAFVQLQTR